MIGAYRHNEDLRVTDTGASATHSKQVLELESVPGVQVRSLR